MTYSPSCAQAPKASSKYSAGVSSTTGANLPTAIWDVLACPAADHGRLRLDGDVVVCESCGNRYPVRDGIPVLVIEEASPTPLDS